MIDRREINIGNYFRFIYIETPVDPQVYRVRNGFDIDTTAILLSTNSLEPIPLTKEILLKCGFEANGFGGFCKSWHPSKYNDSIVTYRVGKGMGDGWTIWEGGFEIKNGIYFVHELQNLYFALTGDELQLSNKINQISNLTA